jgi:hypothetical protein
MTHPKSKEFKIILKDHGYNNQIALVQALKTQGYFLGKRESGRSYINAIIQHRRVATENFIKQIESVCENDPRIRKYFTATKSIDENLQEKESNLDSCITLLFNEIKDNYVTIPKEDKIKMINYFANLIRDYTKST